MEYAPVEHGKRMGKYIIKMIPINKKPLYKNRKKYFAGHTLKEAIWAAVWHENDQFNMFMRK